MWVIVVVVVVVVVVTCVTVWIAESLCIHIAYRLYVSCSVLGAPRNLQLTLTQEDPPMFQASWQPPRNPISSVLGYLVQYGIRGTDDVESKELAADRYRFTTTFLGECSLQSRTLLIVWSLESFLCLTCHVTTNHSWQVICHLRMMSLYSSSKTHLPESLPIMLSHRMEFLNIFIGLLWSNT